MTNESTAIGARTLRWHAQLLGGSDLGPAEVVDRAVALQGQDLAAVLRAIAIRSAPGTTVADVRAAFDRGELVRSWPMRGTLFATTPAHLADLRALTAARTHAAAARRRHDLSLDDEVVERARGILEEGLAERPLLRSEVLEAWEAAGIETTGGRGYHLIVHLAIDGLAHWGAFEETGREQYFTRTPAIVPDDSDPLPRLLRAYVAARGPVTEADAAWWLKLPKTAIRRAAAAAPDLVEVLVDGRPAWVVDPAGRPVADEAPSGVTLIPGFDEWILGYADRSLVASAAAFEAIVPGGNGVFRPAVLVDGVVVGSWRISGAKPPVLDLVETVSAATRRAIDSALEAWPHR